jgi:hypothetical protein
MTENIKLTTSTDISAESIDPKMIHEQLLLLCESESQVPPAPLGEKLVELQKRVIFDAMEKNGIKKLDITYYGGGDSGDITEMAPVFQDSAVHQELEQIRIDQYPEIHRNYSNGSWVNHPGMSNVTIKQAAENLTWEVIALAGHSGWENNEGGGGTFTLDKSEKKIFLEHYDNIVEQDYSNHEF